MSSPKTALRALCTTAALLQLISCASSTATPAPTPQAQKAPAAPQPDPRYLALPTPTKAQPWQAPPVTQFTLKNGLTVWRMTQGNTPLVSIHLMLPRGAAADPKGKAGLTLMTADLLDEGAGKLSALELSDKLGELATDYSSNTGVDYTLLSMDALSENLSPSLELLGDIVLRPALKKSEFDRRKKHHLATALAAHDDPGTSRRRALARVLFGDGYGGLPVSGTLTSLQDITWHDVKRHAKKLTSPHGAHLVIAGRANEEELRALLNQVFGKWRGRAQKIENDVRKAPTGGRAYLIDYPKAAQSSLAIATRAGSDDDANFFAEKVMNQKIGGSFTGRINMNLREDKGYTYGARGDFRRYQHAGYYSISTNVKSETTGASIKEIFKELSDVCTERPLTQKEVNESVEGLLLGYPMRFDQISSMGIRLVQLPVHNRPLDFWSTWPSKINAITKDRANAAAQPYCDKARYNIVIAGDKESVVPQLKKLNIEVVFLDKDGEVIPQ